MRAYTIAQLAPGSYDVLLDGSPIAALVRDVARAGLADEWQVELLDEVPPGERPAPFTAPSHAFRSRPAALEWLGVREEGRRTDAGAVQRGESTVTG